MSLAPFRGDISVGLADPCLLDFSPVQERHRGRDEIAAA